MTHGFLWEKGATIDLGEVDGVDDINAAGQVVGTRGVEGIPHAFVWEKGVITDLPGPSAAGGINDEGLIVGSGWGRLRTNSPRFGRPNELPFVGISLFDCSDEPKSCIRLNYLDGCFCCARPDVAVSTRHTTDP